MKKKGKKIILILVEGYSDLLSLELIKKLNTSIKYSATFIAFSQCLCILISKFFNPLIIKMSFCWV